MTFMFQDVLPSEMQLASVQDRLTALMAQLYDQRADLRDQLLLGLAAVGRGGQGDLGQRIRDEILVVQSKNNAKVGPAAWGSQCTVGTLP